MRFKNNKTERLAYAEHYEFAYRTLFNKLSPEMQKKMTTKKLRDDKQVTDFIRSVVALAETYTQGTPTTETVAS